MIKFWIKVIEVPSSFLIVIQNHLKSKQLNNIDPELLRIKAVSWDYRSIQGYFL